MNHLQLLRRTAVGVLLSAASAGAWAQFDYSLYGVLDLSYGRFEPSGLYREHRVNSNSMSATFLGVNAKYGLDGGWTPGINLETFIRFQDGKTGRRDNDPTFSRQAFVSLGSPYGLLRIGRLQTFLFDATARFNAFGNSPFFSPSVRHVFTAGGIEGVDGDFYWNQAISYQTPAALENVSLSLMYGKGPRGREGDYAGGTAIVSIGLLSVSASGQRVKAHDGFSDPLDETTWQVGGTYIFDVARVFAQYTQTKDRGQRVDSDIATVGVAVPLFGGNLLAQIGSTTADGVAIDRKHTTTSVAYVYPYDDRLDLYAAAMDDRVRGQTRGVSVAAGARFKF